MAWFKVDDAFHSSKPVLRIPRRYRAQAVGLWIMAGTWSAQEESDGFIPDYVLEELCGTPAIAANLVRAGLWIEVTGESQGGSAESGGPGWQFHNWAKYQPTREELEEKREKERVRKANYRMSQRDTKGTSAGRTPGHQRESGTPDPTRPDPTPIEEPDGSSSPRKRATRIPDDFQATPEMVAWSKEHTPDVPGKFETDRFVDYWRGKSGKDATKTDWVATWRNWMRRAQENATVARPQFQSAAERRFQRAAENHEKFQQLDALAEARAAQPDPFKQRLKELEAS